MKKQIVMEGTDKKFLEKVFGCSTMQVWKALHFRSDSDMGRRIRTLALKRGGVLVGDDCGCETIHCADGMMIQRFGNGYVISADKRTGLVRVFRGDVMVDQEFECSVKRLSEMQDGVKDGRYDDLADDLAGGDGRVDCDGVVR